MIAATVLGWLVTGGLAAETIYNWVMSDRYFQEINSNPLSIGDWVRAFSYGMGYFMFMVVTVPLLISVGLLIGRWRFSRGLYSAIAIGIATVALLDCFSDVRLSTILLAGMLIIALVMSLVLMWLPSSEPYFKPPRAETVPEDDQTRAEPVPEEDQTRTETVPEDDQIS